MSKTNPIWIIMICLAVASCKTADIPSAYNFKANEVQRNPFGCWIEIKPNTTDSIASSNIVSGELLASENDTVYLLTADNTVFVLAEKSVEWAVLYTHKSQQSTYFIVTGLLVLPGIIGAIAVSEYAGEFLLMATPALVTGIIQSAIEGSKQRNKLVYPTEKKFSDLKKFARFPGGMPSEIDYNQLYLKKM